MIISISPERSNTSRLGVLGLVSSLTAWRRNFLGHDWLAFAATVLGVFPIYAEAWENLRKRRMPMKLSMTTALVAALCIGQFFSGDLIWSHIDIWHLKIGKFPTLEAGAGKVFVNEIEAGQLAISNIRRPRNMRASSFAAWGNFPRTWTFPILFSMASTMPDYFIFSTVTAFRQA
jgi:hypothetical protein